MTRSSRLLKSLSKLLATETSYRSDDVGKAVPSNSAALQAAIPSAPSSRYDNRFDDGWNRLREPADIHTAANQSSPSTNTIDRRPSTCGSSSRRFPESALVPDALCCPITSCIFEDPVLAEDGITYERQAITQWIQHNATSPMTRQPLSLTNLRPNYAIRNLINELHSTNISASSSTPRASHTIISPYERAPCASPHSYSSSSGRSHYHEKFNNNKKQRRRVALLFGNDSYIYDKKLECCVNDAHAMSMALSSLDFECALACNMRQQEMEDQLMIFGRRIQANDCVLIFFSGHGWETDGELNLAPIDVGGTNGPTAMSSITVGDIITRLERTASNLLIILICDSCRFEEHNFTFKNGTKSCRTTPDQRKLHRVGIRSPTTSQIVILFSCDPGTVTFVDRTKSPYSELTGALLSHLATPHLPIQQLIAKVTQEVIQKSENEQRPWVHLTLREDFCFSN